MIYHGINITENEGRALVACLNYDKLESQLDDNHSVAGPNEFADVLGWNMHQVGGLVASLTQKGLGFEESMLEMTGENYSIFWLSEKGVRVAFAFAADRE